MLKLISLLSLIIFCNASKVDKTLVDKAVGDEVVDAVVGLISKSGVFGIDYRFLLRVAYIESKFGDDPNTFAQRNGQDYNGGIWQVDSTTFVSTQNSAVQSVKELYPKISQAFGLDWNKLTWADCRKPMVSALAARLALVLTGKPIPDTLEAQADYWSKNYNSAAAKGTVQQFVDNVKAMEKQNTCLGKMDLAIVMDASGSITQPNFDLAKKFVADLISTFSVENVNLGFLLFSSSVKVIFTLDSHLDMNAMKTAVLNAPYLNDGTDTGDGILSAVDLLKKATLREGVPKIMLVFTDGNSNEGPGVSAGMNAAKQNGFSTFAIGIGANTNPTELLQIASNDPTHVLSMSSYQSLSESFQMMNTQTCKIAQKPDVGKHTNDTLHKDEKRYYCFELWPQGITVYIDTEVGHTESYYSYAVENPSAALNDGTISGQAFIASPTQLSGFGTNATRVCVSVKGIDNQNNFTIGSDQGNHVTTTPGDDGDDEFVTIQHKAKEIAKEALKNSNNYFKVANQICERLSEDYEKEEWLCVVGERVEVSEHQTVKASFEFGFKVDKVSVYVIVKIPDDSY